MKIYLKCRFSDKEEVKRLGARWDYERKYWFVENPDNLELFAKWVIDKEPPISARKTHKHSFKSFGTTNSLGVSCGCKALPWEDCQHTLTKE
jgi:hypothetical protein